MESYFSLDKEYPMSVDRILENATVMGQNCLIQQIFDNNSLVLKQRVNGSESILL